MYKNDLPLIVGLGHRTGVGKSTAARILSVRLSEAGTASKVVHMMDEPKRIAHRAFSWAGLKPLCLYDLCPELKEAPLPVLGKTPRDIFRAFGNFLRDLHPEALSRALLEQPEIREASVLFVPDIRFPDEVRVLRETASCILCRVDRPSVPFIDDGFDNALADYDAWDLVVQNNGPIWKFAQALDPLLSLIQTRMRPLL